MSITSLSTRNPCKDFDEDVKYFLKQLKIENPAAWYCLKKRIQLLSKEDYAVLVPLEENREKLNVKAFGRFLRDLTEGKTSTLLNKNTASFNEHLTLNYLKPVYFRHIYEKDVVVFIEHLKKDNALAWNIFEEIFSSNVKNMPKFKEIKDEDVKKDVLQNTRIAFQSNLKAEKVDLGKLYHSTSGLIAYFKQIAYYECINYFRTTTKIDTINLDSLEINESREYGEETSSTDPKIIDDDPKLDDFIISIEKNNDDKGEVVVGNINDWKNKAVMDCLDKLDNEDIELSTKKGKDKKEWRKIFEMKVIDSKKHKVIADELKIEETICQNRLGEAIKLLRKCMNLKGISR